MGDCSHSSVQAGQPQEEQERTEERETWQQGRNSAIRSYFFIYFFIFIFNFGDTCTVVVRELKIVSKGYIAVW